MHVAGLLWALDPKVDKALNITDDQKKKIKELHKAAHKDTQEAFAISDKAAREAKFEELHKARRADRRPEGEVEGTGGRAVQGQARLPPRGGEVADRGAAHHQPSSAAVGGEPRF
jgi:hypothetical protein